MIPIGSTIRVAHPFDFRPVRYKGRKGVVVSLDETTPNVPQYRCSFPQRKRSIYFTPEELEVVNGNPVLP